MPEFSTLKGVDLVSNLIKLTKLINEKLAIKIKSKLNSNFKNKNWNKNEKIKLNKLNENIERNFWIYGIWNIKSIYNEIVSETGSIRNCFLREKQAKVNFKTVFLNQLK